MVLFPVAFTGEAFCRCQAGGVKGKPKGMATGEAVCEVWLGQGSTRWVCKPCLTAIWLKKT